MSVTYLDPAASNHQVISAKKVASPDVLPTPLVPPTLRSSPKIRDRHRDRLAVVYVRQSSPHQVLENRESRERQYGLAMLAQQFGWPADRVLVIDEDQGLSGKRAENRGGFQRLLNEVAMDHVGMVLGLELSRLARSYKDWHHLVEVCAVFDTLLYDQDGVYNANDGNKVKKKSEKSFFSKKTEFSLLTFCNIWRSAAFCGVKIGKIGDRIANIGQKISNIDTPVMNFDVKKCELRHSHRDRRDKNKNIDHSVTNSGMKCCLIGKKCCRIGKKTAGQMKA